MRPDRHLPPSTRLQDGRNFRLEVRTLTGEDLKSRLDGIELEFEERIALVAELSRRPELHLARTAALLLDQSGKTVDAKMRVFMSPVTTDLVEFPEGPGVRVRHTPTL